MDKLIGASGRIRKAALEAGILPNDPLGPLYEALADLPCELRLELSAITEAAAQHATETTKEAARYAAAIGAQGMLIAADRLVRQRWWQFSAWIALAAIALVLIAGAIGYWIGRPPAMQCEGQNGGIVCFTWLKPPTKQ